MPSIPGSGTCVPPEVVEPPELLDDEDEELDEEDELELLEEEPPHFLPHQPPEVLPPHPPADAGVVSARPVRTAVAMKALRSIGVIPLLP